MDLEDQVIPPTPPATVYRFAGIGFAFAGMAAILGLFLPLEEPAWPNTLRLLLVSVGLITAGAATSLRPRLPIVWLIQAAAFAVAYFGIPPHWDSARLVASVASGVSVGAAILAALPWTIRSIILSLIAVWHFGGILCATTWPEPTPWITAQVGTRVYLPYLMFMYLRNAYHFYSPDPGPASLLCCLITYDLDTPMTDPKTGKQVKSISEWVTLPDRTLHLKDPLALAYYRRLSITEQVAGSVPNYTQFNEMQEVNQRRSKAAGEFGGYSNYPVIPMAPADVEAAPYRMPRPDVVRLLLPSYAEHLLVSNTRNGQKATSVKIYRLEHRVLPVAQFVRGSNPHHPTTFRPFFSGNTHSPGKTTVRNSSIRRIRCSTGMCRSCRNW